MPSLQKIFWFIFLSLSQRPFFLKFWQPPKSCKWRLQWWRENLTFKSCTFLPPYPKMHVHTLPIQNSTFSLKKYSKMSAVWISHQLWFTINHCWDHPSFTGFDLVYYISNSGSRKPSPRSPLYKNRRAFFSVNIGGILGSSTVLSKTKVSHLVAVFSLASKINI